MEYSVPDASERNKAPILEIISNEFAHTKRVLEIGSGGGTHALHFSAHLPHLSWQPTDRDEYLPALRERLRREGGPNLLEAIELDVRAQPWPIESADGVFSANTLHIMSWDSVQQFFRGVGAVLANSGAPGRPGTNAESPVLCIYGPFRYGDRFTSQSNVEFDEFLRRRDPESGIRDAHELGRLAREHGLEQVADHAMPANNQLLVWKRV
jgi:hypothetical protein